MHINQYSYFHIPLYLYLHSFGTTLEHKWLIISSPFVKRKKARFVAFIKICALYEVVDRFSGLQWILMLPILTQSFVHTDLSDFYQNGVCLQWVSTRYGFFSQCNCQVRTLLLALFILGILYTYVYMLWILLSLLDWCFSVSRNPW